MQTMERKYVFSGVDEEGIFIDLLSVGAHGALVLTQNRTITPLLLKGVDDVDQIITALNMLRNYMVQAGAE